MSRRTWMIVIGIAAVACVARAAAFHGLDLYTDEAYYWLWSTRPAAGYFDHPPMVAWVVWLSSRILPGETGVRLLFAVMGGLTVLFTALAARALRPGDRAPIYGALLAAGAPMLHLVGALALPDGPVVTFYSASLWLLAEARGRRWLWAGVAVGLALLSKYTAALLAPALLLLVLWDRELRAELRTRWPWLGGAVAVLVFSPNLIWNARHDWIAIGFQLQHGFRSGSTLRSFLEFLGAQLAEAGPVAMVLGMALAVRARSSAEKRLAVGVLLPLVVMIYAAARGDVEVNWPALTYPGTAALAAAWLARRTPKLGMRLAAAQACLGAALLLFFAVEIRAPHLLQGSIAVARFHAGSGLGRLMREAATAACRDAGGSPDCAGDPFVFPSSWQYAGHLAYYAGWRRLGPAEERRSQLDLWADQPRAGEPIFYAGQDHGPGPLFRGSIRASGEGPISRFQVIFDGRPVRAGTITPFARYDGGEIKRDLRPRPGAR